jgi:hypothetical protein
VSIGSSRDSSPQVSVADTGTGMTPKTLHWQSSRSARSPAGLLDPMRGSASA